MTSDLSGAQFSLTLLKGLPSGIARAGSRGLLQGALAQGCLDGQSPLEPEPLDVALSISVPSNLLSDTGLLT